MLLLSTYPIAISISVVIIIVIMIIIVTITINISINRMISIIRSTKQSSAPPQVGGAEERDVFTTELPLLLLLLLLLLVLLPLITNTINRIISIIIISTKQSSPQVGGAEERDAGRGEPGRRHRLHVPQARPRAGCFVSLV